MKLSAADTYIASLYERFVDKGLHLAQIKDELAYKGIKRNLFQIAYDLDTRYGFYGYAASHSAPAKVTAEAADREIELLPRSLLNRALSREVKPCDLRPVSETSVGSSQR